MDNSFLKKAQQQQQKVHKAKIKCQPRGPGCIGCVILGKNPGIELDLAG